MDAATVSSWCGWTAEQVVRLDGLVREYWVFAAVAVGVYVTLKFCVHAFGYFPGRKSVVHIPLDGFRAPPSEFTGRRIDFINPRTGENMGSENAATEREVEECVRRCGIAQKEWAKTSFDERRAFLRDLIETVLVHQDEICEASVRTTGKTTMEGRFGEVGVTLEKARWTLNNGEEWLKPDFRRAPMMFAHRYTRVQYSPMGVIAAIVPWNYPLHNALSPLISALFSGNGCVVKWSEFACYPRAWLLEIVRSLLRSRGHNPDLVQFIPGYGDAGAALVGSAGVAKILFIGSPETGKRVMVGAAKNLTPVILELGGKDAMIMLEDAEIDFAVQLAVRGSFINCGQNCLSSERTFIHRAIYDKVVEKIVDNMKGWRPGCDYGTLAVEMQLNKVEEAVADAVAHGATIKWGGQRGAKGLFKQPTILTNVRPDMKIMQEEVFGPVMCLVPFDDEEELLKMVNSCKYGLCCSVISANQARAEKLASQIESGMAVVNEFGFSYMIQDAPFGGVKTSGFGVFNGAEGLRGFSNAQILHGERFWMPLGLKLPPFMMYPMFDNSHRVVKHSLEILFGWGVGTKIRAIGSVIKAAMNLGERGKVGGN